MRLSNEKNMCFNRCHHRNTFDMNCNDWFIVYSKSSVKPILQNLSVCE